MRLHNKILDFWFSFILLFMLPIACYSEVLATTGQTFKIIEEDLIERLHREIKKGEWKKEMTPEKVRHKLETLKPRDLARLPRASKDREWTPDLRWKLDFDVTDKDGNILYPKGFVVDPVAYVHLTGKYVIFDPQDELQMKWFIDSKFTEDGRVKVMVSGGSFLNLSKTFRRPIYYLPQQVVNRFKITALPVIIEQSRGRLLVREIVVSKMETP